MQLDGKWLFYYGQDEILCHMEPPFQVTVI